MRVKQLWQRLAARERVLAGAALLALLLVGVRYGIIEPYLTYTAHLNIVNFAPFDAREFLANML